MNRFFLPGSAVSVSIPRFFWVSEEAFFVLVVFLRLYAGNRYRLFVQTLYIMFVIRQCR